MFSNFHYTTSTITLDARMLSYSVRILATNTPLPTYTFNVLTLSARCTVLIYSKLVLTSIFHVFAYKARMLVLSALTL